VLFRIVPVSPTTKPVPESRRTAPLRLLVVPESTGDHCPKTVKLEDKIKKDARQVRLRLDMITSVKFPVPREPTQSFHIGSNNIEQCKFSDFRAHQLEKRLARPARQVKPGRTRSPAKVADSDYDESLVTGANYGADARRGVGRGRGVGCGLGDGVGLGVGVAVGVGVRVGVGVGVAVPDSEYFIVV
jgi:hypothetical protein